MGLHKIIKIIIDFLIKKLKSKNHKILFYFFLHYNFFFSLVSASNPTHLKFIKFGCFPSFQRNSGKIRFFKLKQVANWFDKVETYNFAYLFKWHTYRNPFFCFGNTKCSAVYNPNNFCLVVNRSLNKGCNSAFNMMKIYLLLLISLKFMWNSGFLYA